jgi:hypothetical protein
LGEANGRFLGYSHEAVTRRRKSTRSIARSGTNAKYTHIVRHDKSNESSLYAYVNSKPVSYGDPFGLVPYATCSPAGSITYHDENTSTLTCVYDCMCPNGTGPHPTSIIAPTLDSAYCSTPPAIAAAIATGNVTGDCDNTPRQPPLVPVPFPAPERCPVRIPSTAAAAVPVAGVAAFLALALAAGLLLFAAPAVGTVVVVGGIAYIFVGSSGSGGSPMA